MKKIFSIGDSNTWGYIPGSLNESNFSYQQFPYHQRWTGILERELGSDYSLVEEAFPGRTIMTEDEQMLHASSMSILKNDILINAKPDWVIIMLGTNDLKISYQLSPHQIAAHMDEFCQNIQVDCVRHANKAANILLIAPPIISQRKLSHEWQVYYAGRNIEKDSAQLTSCFEDLAKKNYYQFCDASQLVFSGESDGLHLDQDSHQRLALLLKKIIIIG